MTRAFLFTAALLFATGGAGAQNAPSTTPSPNQPSTVGAAPPSPGQAPVGHRQPKQSDLPPSVADQEKVEAEQNAQRKALEGNLDKQLRICSGC